MRWPGNSFCVHAGVSIVDWEGKFMSRGMKRPFKLYRNAHNLPILSTLFWQSCTLNSIIKTLQDLSPCLLPSILAGPVHHKTQKSDLCQLEIRSLLLQSTWEGDGERWSLAPLASRLLTSAEQFKPSLNKVCSFHPHPKWSYWSQRIPPEDICMGKKQLKDKQSLTLCTCPSGAVFTSSS